MKIITGKNPCHAGVIAICGNPNCGKTTIFNAITGLNQQVGNYPGVTVEKVTGQFSRSHNSSDKFTLLDIPGTYSLSAFTPDEYIAASALFGELESETRPDVIITVIDATNLERGLYLLFQVMQIGCPVVVALNMIDMAKKNKLKINYNKLSKYLGNVPVVPVVGISGKGIDRLKEETAQLVGQIPDYSKHSYDDFTENLLGELISRYGNTHHSRAQYIRIIFDEDGPAEKKFIKEEGKEAAHVIKKGREKIRNQFGSLVIAETKVLTNQSTQIYNEVVKIEKTDKLSFSAKVDKYLLHPVIGPLFLVLLMLLVFQSIFTWAEPFMAMIDTFFSSLAGIVSKSIAEGPLQSLLTDGLIGGVGSVLVFIPQIAILFIFIAILEDSGYMTRSAFLVDRMFRWCGLSGKSFIPLLSSFACAVPGIMATRTIEDRKLRFITIIVAPLMTCSARLPVYTIMIAAFIPYKMYFGFINLQGLVLALLYLLGVITAVLVSFVLKKTIFKTERSTFLMEMPSYRLPTFRSIAIRVINRVKLFIVRAGTVILAITIIIWALTYYPQSAQVSNEYNREEIVLKNNYEENNISITDNINMSLISQPSEIIDLSNKISNKFALLKDETELDKLHRQFLHDYPVHSELISLYYQQRISNISYHRELTDLLNKKAGEQVRNSYLGVIGRKVEFIFLPLGWDWKITMSVLASFPAREVIIATLGTIYNLGSEVDGSSSSLKDRMRQSKWEDGSKMGLFVFSPSVALSIMVFFALCCQCGATLVTIRQETSSWFYPVMTFIYMTILAYVGALFVYQLLSRLGM